jgi:hypothetical protein
LPVRVDEQVAVDEQSSRAARIGRRPLENPLRTETTHFDDVAFQRWICPALVVSSISTMV